MTQRARRIKVRESMTSRHVFMVMLAAMCGVATLMRMPFPEGNRLLQRCFSPAGAVPRA